MPKLRTRVEQQLSRPTAAVKQAVQTKVKAGIQVKAQQKAEEKANAQGTMQNEENSQMPAAVGEDAGPPGTLPYK